MPRPRTPTNVLKLRGADRQHPERMKERENEPEDDRPLGDPPEGLGETEAAIWRELAGNAIPGVLGKSDRVAMESTCKLLARLRDQQAVDDVRRETVMDAINAVDAGDEDSIIYALRLVVRYVTAPPPFSASDQANLTTLLRQMGMAPADRSKIQMPGKSNSGNKFDDD